MMIQHTQTAATVSKDIIFFTLFDEIEKPDTLQISWQDTEVLLEFGSAVGITIKRTSPPLGGGEQLDFSEPFRHGKSALPELHFEQEFSDTQQPHFTFPTNTGQILDIIDLADEDMLDIMRSRAVEQEVLDLLDEPISQ